MVHCTNRQKHSKPLVYKSSQVYQDCTNSVPTVYQSSKTVKNSQKQSKDSQNSKNDHWRTNRHRSTKTVPTVYQSSKTVKTAQNDHWCTSRHTSTKTVPNVYQQCTKNSQKTLKTAKMTIGVPTITVLPILYQQCNNSLSIVNKNLAIANRSRVSCAHNTSRVFIGLNITP